MSRDSGLVFQNLDKTDYSLATTSRGVLRAVHRGTVTIAASAATGTATIAPTTSSMNKLRLVPLGCITDGTTLSGQNHFGYIVLTNTTTITATRNASNGNFLTFSFEVWEEYE